MQVFKSFFKIFKKHSGLMIMYLCLFIAILTVVSKSRAEYSQDSYTSSLPKFAVFDQEQSKRSSTLIKYLEKTCERVEIKDDKKETMQDELYNRNVHCVLIINKDGKTDVVTIPNTQYAQAFESKLDSFDKMYATYETAGYTDDEIETKIMSSLDIKAEVSLSNGKDATAHSASYYTFSYLAWLLVVMLIIGLAPVLQVFSKKDIKERIACSAYKFSNFNKELLLAVIVTGIVICMIIFAAATIMLKGATFSYAGLLYSLNMVCYMIFSISLAFLISKLTQNEQALNMLANTLSLGMAFLCGIFVPEEFLSPAIINIAHFLPAYWYNQAVRNIDFHLDTAAPTVFTCMGIELLFAAAVTLVALKVSRIMYRNS